ncbi:unnamed protein product [Moneuplotes crassus]|uniref:Uncharacterized protein n=1 Tax=Euplotes crassus TaxID=5936 RepID=A0AAD1XTC8_EUPCR|nr:unnamed protein product [Moneuplotes crassus]
MATLCQDILSLVVKVEKEKYILKKEYKIHFEMNHFFLEVFKIFMLCTSFPCNLTGEYHFMEVLLKRLKTPWVALKKTGHITLYVTNRSLRKKSMKAFFSRFKREISSFQIVSWERHQNRKLYLDCSPIIRDLVKNLSSSPKNILLNNLVLSPRQFLHLLCTNPLCNTISFSFCKFLQGTVKTTLKGKSALKDLKIVNSSVCEDRAMCSREYIENVLENVGKCPCKGVLEIIRMHNFGVDCELMGEIRDKLGFEGIQFEINTEQEFMIVD